MTSRDFCYWLQGAIEAGQIKTFNEEQVEKIKAHLSLVFIHEIDPSFPKEQQDQLNKTHNGNPYTGLRC